MAIFRISVKNDWMPIYILDFLQLFSVLGPLTVFGDADLGTVACSDTEIEPHGDVPWVTPVGYCCYACLKREWYKV